MNHKSFYWILFSFLSCTGLMGACSTTPPVKTQAYAKLSSQRTFEYDLPTVWQGIERSFQNYKVSRRDPDEVDPVEMKKLKKRILETDWIYSQSRDKYVEFKVNGFPRKQFLQTRIKYSVVAQKTLGGTDVKILATEEVEKLKSDGNPDGYEEVESSDSARTHEILEKIQNSILSAAP
jgi:hypothetical protein